jgi:FkbM family methyltransferase
MSLRALMRLAALGAAALLVLALAHAAGGPAGAAAAALLAMTVLVVLRRSLTRETARLEATVARHQAEIVALRAELAALRGEGATQRGEMAVLRGESIRAIREEMAVLRIGLRDSFRRGHLDPALLDNRAFDPEPDIIAPLALVLGNRRAVDVGANRGEFAAALRRAGFEVDAFEPLPALAAELARRFRDDRLVRVHAMACSDQPGRAALHLSAERDAGVDATLFSSLSPHPMPESLAFERMVEVPVATLDDALAADGGTLAVGLLKTDTEGHDLRVLAGATRIEAEAILAECWEAGFPFNAGQVANRLEDYLAFVDRQRYPHHMLMWRGPDAGEYGISENPETMPARSWGNVLFLRSAAAMAAVLDFAEEWYGPDRVVRNQPRAVADHAA